MLQAPIAPPIPVSDTLIPHQGLDDTILEDLIAEPVRKKFLGHLVQGRVQAYSPTAGEFVVCYDDEAIADEYLALHQLRSILVDQALCALAPVPRPKPKLELLVPDFSKHDVLERKALRKWRESPPTSPVFGPKSGDGSYLDDRLMLKERRKGITPVQRRLDGPRNDFFQQRPSRTIKKRRVSREHASSKVVKVKQACAQRSDNKAEQESGQHVHQEEATSFDDALVEFDQLEHLEEDDDGPASPTHGAIAPGTLVEVRFLYGHAESRSVRRWELGHVASVTSAYFLVEFEGKVWHERIHTQDEGKIWRRQLRPSTTSKAVSTLSTRCATSGKMRTKLSSDLTSLTSLECKREESWKDDFNVFEDTSESEDEDESDAEYKPTCDWDCTSAFA